jgi:hypothetical protein
LLIVLQLPGYDPGKKKIHGFALVVSCSSFKGKMIPDLEGVSRDHDEVAHYLTHPLYAKFDSADCIFLHDVTLIGLRAALAGLARMIMTSLDRRRQESGEYLPSSLFVYICTHAAQIRQKKNAKNYLLTSDSDWMDSSVLAETSLPLSELADCIKEIPVEQKLVVAHVAHGEPPDKATRKTRILYPTAAFYDELAAGCGAIVVGSAKIGAHNHTDLGSVLASEEEWLGKRHSLPDPLPKIAESKQLTIILDGGDDDTSHITLATGTFPSSLCQYSQSDDLVCGNEEKHELAAAVRAGAEHTSGAAVPCGRLNHKSAAKFESSIPGTALVGTLFGQSVCKALRGEILTLPYAVAGLDALNFCLSLETACLEYPQTPSVCVIDRWWLVEWTLFDRPSPPPSPSQPRLAFISRSRITLEWDDNFTQGEFGGAPPTLWQLERRGTLRNNSEWAAIGFPVNRRRLSPPGLVPGISFRYRIRAWSAGGGWSKPGEPSDFFELPGFVNPPPQVEIRELFARRGGAVAVIARMARQMHSVDVQRAGIRQLNAHFGRSSKERKSLAQQSMEVVCEAMQRFEQDAAIQAEGCLVLGWAAAAFHGGASSCPLYERARDCIEVAIKMHGTESSVQCRGIWALRELTFSTSEIRVM